MAAQLAINFERPQIIREVEAETGAVEVKFDGAEYSPKQDDVRLAGQLLRVFNLMKDGEWRTLDQIARATRDPHASISAQIRHLRKARFGGHNVERKHLGDGLYAYKLIVRSREQ
jgi:hypothetical protein